MPGCDPAQVSPQALARAKLAQPTVTADVGRARVAVPINPAETWRENLNENIVAFLRS
jgi:hypothetical protein